MTSSFFSLFKEPENLFLTAVNPTPVIQPQIIGWSSVLARELEIEKDQKWADILGGNLVTENMTPFAARYGGHQFGHWAGQLGDGRAITLGEIAGYELQLKGSGLTPYSRQGDGRAVLRSSLREFICSEAMHALGVPTTRALSLLITGEGVVRDLLYDGNPAEEKGAITSRLSPSFVRFGNFEILAAAGKTEELKKLADYIMEKFYPEAKTYADFLKQVTIRTAHMVSDWMSLGFVHGVMNTDNMSILGLTMDYGPYGWVEEFDPDFTPNTTDFSQRRYRYAHQPDIALWNLNALANAMFPLIEDKDLVIESLNAFQMEYESTYMKKMSLKLGCELDGEILSDLFQLMYDTKIDYTLFFRNLSQESFEMDFEMLSYLKEIPADLKEKWDVWLMNYKKNIRCVEVMKKNNPSIIFRNYLAQQAIDAADQGNYQLIEKYLKELEQPFKERDLKTDPLTFKRPMWADDKPGCSFLSCSS